MGFRRFILFGWVLAAVSGALATPVKPTGIYRGSDLQPLSLAELLAEIPRGAILLLGEQHGVLSHRNQHLRILRGLREAGHRVSVGLEFFEYPHQATVEAWRRDELPEEEFLKRIAWKGFSFDFYREQARFPRASEGSETLALNAPGWLTRQIAQGGLDSLSGEARGFLPPNFELGRSVYRERFAAMMPHLPDPSALDRYFAAQSTWDDTMAWRAAEFKRDRPGETLVIVVGQFHVEYGGGLPDRLRARTSATVRTLFQLNADDAAPEDIERAMDPRGPYGARADWIWVDESRVPEPAP